MTLPVGKLPADLLAKLLARIPLNDPRVVLGPGIGLDCAIVEAGPVLWVFKSDPITFATDEIGWYAVQVNANDIATTGATPRWLLLTMLLPEKATTAQLVEGISRQVQRACEQLGIAVIGGHTEITLGVERPILMGTLIGQVDRDQLVTPRGANPGDRILLTKGVPIEATALLAREFPDRLSSALSADEIARAGAFLFDPGISVVPEARIATKAGHITAMHDPTEGGLAMALWELAEASGRALSVDPGAVPIPSLSRRVCSFFGLDPLAALASGALLLTTPAVEAPLVCRALEFEGIHCAEIGAVDEGPMFVWRKTATGREPWPRPARDEIAHVFEEANPSSRPG